MTPVVPIQPSAQPQPRRSRGRRAGSTVVLLSALAVPALAFSALALPAGAQSESFLLNRGSKVGPASKVKATNCKTAADGTITCDTKIDNPPGDTLAKPQYSPFKQ